MRRLNTQLPRMSPTAISGAFATVTEDSPVTITCETSGATEGLTYDWSADEGTVEGNGATIVWTAPDHGAKIQVSVMVRDPHGVEEIAALHFRVATCECVYKRYE